MEFGSSRNSTSVDKVQAPDKGHCRRLFPKVPTLEMVESGSSDDDNEVSLIPNVPKRNRLQRIFDRQRQEEENSNEEQRQDNVLKELGMFEEGMSKEQKQELIMVIEASKQSAKKEASKRRSKEWELDVTVINNSHTLFTPTEPSNANGSPVSSLALVNEERVTDLVTVGDSDDDTQINAVEEIPSTSNMEKEPVEYWDSAQNHVDSSKSYSIREETESSEKTTKSGRWLSRLTRKRLVQHDRKRFAMEDAIGIWMPQNAAVVEEPLFRKTVKHLFEEVPYYCPMGKIPTAYTKSILNDMNRYRICLQVAQLRLSSSIPYGEPILLGRSRPLGRYSQREGSFSAGEHCNPSEDLEELSFGCETKQSEEFVPVDDDPFQNDVFTLSSQNYSPDCADELGNRENNEKPVNEGDRSHHPNFKLDFDERSDGFELTSEDFPELGSGENDLKKKPKQIRKRNKDVESSDNVVSNNKKQKLQLKKKYGSIVKSLSIPLRRVELTPEFKKYAGSTTLVQSSIQ